MQFEWNPAKAAANILKHGVSFDEASTVFGDTLSVSGRDLEHSVSEARLITIGQSSEARVLIACHTDRANVIRIYSARLATKKEKKIYEEG